MSATEVYQLAGELTEQESDNIIGGWNAFGDDDALELYNSLVRLGDSKQVAIATVIVKKHNSEI